MTMQPHPLPMPASPRRLPAAAPITVAFGDGIGPEIMNASLRVLLAAGARLEFESVHIGESLYRQGNTAGIGRETWDSLRRTRVFYKAPITTPQGSGFKSLNVTVRKTLGLYANVRPSVAYAPFVPTKHPGMDVVIVRENEEDLYAGIEHRQTEEVYQCLKLITRPGTERIVRYAFEYAVRNGRKKVSCFTKDNIMKLTDGLFHRVFDEIGAEYPQLQKEHFIVDIGAARLADRPESFDVIVTPNLYGDILSDIAAEVAGSIGLASSANIGPHVAMFEAVHGSAPDIAGQDIANPSGLLLAGVQMLVHLGQHDVARLVHNAWLKTIEDGIHTADLYHAASSRQQVGTEAFADAVVARLGESPSTLKPFRSATGVPARASTPPAADRKAADKVLVGVDVFVDCPGIHPDDLANRLRSAGAADLPDLVMITNRGVKVWPDGLPETYCTDHWRARFQARAGQAFNGRGVAELLSRLSAAGIDFIKTEGLYTFDGQPGFSLGQGQ